MLETLRAAGSDQPGGPITGVRDVSRLRAVAEADLAGHLGDPDLDAVVSTLHLACDSPMAVVSIVSPNLQTYPAEIGLGAPCTVVPDSLSFCAQVVETGRPFSVSDAAAHPIHSQHPMVLAGAIGAYAGVPLVDNGFVLGSVAIFNPEARVFSADILEILRHQGRLAASVLALRRSARSDVLTGLPNRALYADRLGRALARLGRHDGMVCVMYLDIDNFKSINDIYGHIGGDQVLVELGRRLSSLLRPSDTLARFGGDEFVILCEDLGTVGDAERLAGRMVAATNEPWSVRDQAVYVDVSIGFALADSPRTESSGLLRDADEAMYSAKMLAGSKAVMAPRRQYPPVLQSVGRRRRAGGLPPR